MQISSDSSFDSDSPSLEVLKSPQLQKKVDKRVRELEHSSQCSGGILHVNINQKRREYRSFSQSESGMAP